MANDQDPEKDSSTVQFPLNAEGYKLLCEIGVSERSIVHKAICVSTNSVVAVKIINLDGSEVTDDQFFAEQANSLSLFHRPNILTPHCSFMVDRHLWVVMPFFPSGSLQTLAAFRYYRGFYEQFLAIILREVLSAFVHLHDLGYIYRDLKQSNIFIDSEGVVKLSEVKLTSSFFDSQSRLDAPVPYWIAPEVVRSEYGYSTKSDIWSFGILALELAYGCPPITDMRAFKSLLLKISRRFQYSLNIVKIVSENLINRKFSPEFKDLVDSCLAKDPSDRPSAMDLLTHPFIERYVSTNYLFDTITADMPAIEDRFGENKRRLMSLMKNNNNADEGDNRSIIPNPKITGWNFNKFIFELEPEEESSVKKVRFTGETIIPSKAGPSRESLLAELTKMEGGSQNDMIKKGAIIDFLLSLLTNVDEQRETIAMAVAQLGGHLEKEEAMQKEIEVLKEELAAEKDKSFQLELDLEVLKLRLPGSEGEEQFWNDP